MKPSSFSPGEPNLHHAAAFLPWMLYAIDRLREAPGVRTALPLGALAALHLAEGHPQMCYVSAFALGPVLAYRLATSRHRGSPPAGPPRWARITGALALAGLVTLILSGAYLWSGYQLYTISERGADSVDRWDFCTRFALAWENVFTLGWAHIFGNGANATYDPRHGLFWESWMYIGALPCAAALLAVLAGARRAVARRWRGALPALGWLLLALFAFSLMMGRASPVYALAFRFVPGMTWFRFPQRFALVLEVAALLLAAIGLDAIITAVERRGGRALARACGAALLAATTADIVYFTSGHFYAIPRSIALRPPATVKALRALAPPEPWRFLSIFGPESHGEAFDTAKGWQRWRPYVPQWAVLQPSTHLFWGLESAGGYTSMVPEDVASVLGSHNAIGLLSWPRAYWADRPDACSKQPVHMSGKCRASVRCAPSMARAYGAFNVRFVLSPAPLDGCSGWTLRDTIKTAPYEIGIYENTLVLPRASDVQPFAAHGIQIGVDLPAGTHEVTVERRPRYAPLVAAGADGWAALCALALYRLLRRAAALFP